MSTDRPGAYALLEVAVEVVHPNAQGPARGKRLKFGEWLADQLSVSGVNLDEEAANMVRFQQAYQAAAQLIGVAL